jgi:Fe-S-cluster containining protein
MIKIKQLIPQGYCLKCRGCCRFSKKHSVWEPRLLAEEKNNVGPIDLVADGQEGAFVCSLLNASDNNCRAYASRPFECRLYPFLLSLKENKKFLAIDLNCPFVKENKDTQAFKAYCAQIAALMKSPAFSEVLRNNPQMFQPYAGVSEITEMDF